MNGRVMVNQFLWQRITRLLEHTSVKVWENYWRLESGSKNGGTASLPEFVLGKQNYRKVDHFTTWLSGTFQKLWLFYPERLSQKKLLYSFWLQNLNSIGSFQGPCVQLGCFIKLEVDVFIVLFLLNSAIVRKETT